MTIQPSGVSSFSGSRYSGSPVRNDDHRAVLEQAAGVAFAHELHQVGAEGDVEDRFRIGGGNRLHHRAGVDLALRRPLLVDPLDVGTLLRHQLLEHRDRGLAVFIVRRDRRPALGRQFCGLFHQHRRLHVVGRTQAEGVAVALRPGDGVGQRFGGEEEHLLLVGEIADGEADVGQERAGQHRDVLARHQFVGGGLRIGRLAAVILGDDDELLAVDAAGGVDFLDRELPALAIGLGEGRQQRIAVDLADLDLALRHGGLRHAARPRSPSPRPANISRRIPNLHC